MITTQAPRRGQVVNVIQTEPKAATHSRAARVTAELVGASFIDACFAAQRTMEQISVSSKEGDMDQETEPGTSLQD